MEDFFNDTFTSDFTLAAQSFVVALIILLVGWIVAKILGNLVESGMKKANLDEKLFNKVQTGEKQVDVNKIVGKVIYYIVLVIAFMLFFERLNLHVLANPLSDVMSTIFNFVPAVLKAAIILAVAWIVATIVKWLITSGTDKAKIQEGFYKIKLADTKDEVRSFMETLGQVAFYLILFVSVPAILNALNISGLAEPFTGLMSTVLAFIPKVLAAAIIFAVGWFVAKIVRTILTNLLEAVGSEKVVERLHLKKLFEESSLAQFVGNIVFVVIIILTSIVSLEKLELTGITGPAINMLQTIVEMIPNVLIAIALVLIGVWLGKLVGGFVQTYLGKLGFDRLTSKINVGNADAAEQKMTPSAVVGYIVQALIIFVLAVQALNLIKLDFLVEISTAITAYIPHVLAAVVILIVALILAGIVEKILLNLISGPATKILASFAKYAVLVLAVFMALSQLGIATSIVNAAFILILGGLALAFGLAFGLGGKDFASKYLKKFDETIETTTVKNDNENKNE